MEPADTLRALVLVGGGDVAQTTLVAELLAPRYAGSAREGADPNEFAGAEQNRADAQPIAEFEGGDMTTGVVDQGTAGPTPIEQEPARMRMVQRLALTWSRVGVLSLVLAGAGAIATTYGASIWALVLIGVVVGEVAFVGIGRRRSRHWPGIYRTYATLSPLRHETDRGPIAIAGGFDLSSAVWGELPAKPTLVPPHRALASTSPLLRTRREGRIDWSALVREASRGRPPESLPTSRRWSVRRTIDVLIDESGALEPFESDIADLLARLERQCDEVRVLRFDDDPRFITGHDTPTAEWTPGQPYVDQLPRRGTRIVVIGDLGISRLRTASLRVGPSVWLDVDRDLVTRGMEPIYLVLYGARRVPSSLRRHLSVAILQDQTLGAPR